MSVGSLAQQGRRAAHGREVEWLGRTGLLAQGVIYALVALLAIQVAVDGRDSSQKPDKQGALKLVAEQPFGKVLLAVLALGFLAYALWRFAQALADRSGKGGDAKGLAKRAGYAALGLWYVGLAALAALMLFGSRAGQSSGGGGEKKATAGVLDMTLGRELVLAAATGILVAAGWNVYRAFGGELDKHLRTWEMSRGERTAVITMGAIGYAARGAVFALIGIFLAKAAIDYKPSEAKSLDGALLELAQRPFGPYLLGAVALGLFAFALWCGAQARYREV